jgi:chromosome segregation ATPase
MALALLERQAGYLRSSLDGFLTSAGDDRLALQQRRDELDREREALTHAIEELSLSRETCKQDMTRRGAALDVQEEMLVKERTSLAREREEIAEDRQRVEAMLKMANEVVERADASRREGTRVDQAIHMLFEARSNEVGALEALGSVIGKLKARVQEDGCGGVQEVSFSSTDS